MIVEPGDERAYQENLRNALVWKRELFTNPRDYNRMIGAIRRNRYEWQYFNGLAFTDPYFAAHAHDQILREAQMAVAEMKKMTDKQGDLVMNLDLLISGFEKEEMSLFEHLKTKLSAVGLPSTATYSPRMRVQQKVDNWSELLNGPLQQAIANFQNNGVQLNKLKGQEVLYCFLMSRELYDEIKNTPLIRMRLSRKDWERAYTGKSEKYDKGQDSPEFRALEDEFAKAFYKKRGAKDGISTAILAAFKAAFNDIKIFGEEQKNYLNFINNSFLEMKKKTGGKTDYSIIHDALREWGAEIFEEINKELEKEHGIEFQLKKISVGNDKATFFLIENTGGNQSNGGTDLSAGLKKAILNSLRKRITNGYAENLTIQGMGKATFTSDLFEKALNIWETTSPTTIASITNNFLNNMSNKKLDSSSFLSGVLGELASLYTSIGKISSLKVKMTGGKQQRYRYGNAKYSNGDYSDAAVLGNFENFHPLSQEDLMTMTPEEISKYEKRIEKWKKSFKGTGEFFSDVEISDGLQTLTGINIKRYISDENTFTLFKSQKGGLNLNSHQLRRYLPEKEIILLSYLQENYEIFNDNQDVYSITLPDIKETAEKFVYRNITRILRITGAGFQTVNFLFFANGRWIPASAILQYAKDRLIRQQQLLFEISNTQPMSYWSIGYQSASEVEDETGLSFPKKLDETKLDIAQLRYIERVKAMQSLTFRFKTFTVNIKHLLSL